MYIYIYLYIGEREVPSDYLLVGYFQSFTEPSEQ